jgi:hypothetical protein
VRDKIFYTPKMVDENRADLPALAFVSSHGEPCANAQYTDKLAKIFAVSFNTTILDIQSAATLKQPGLDAENKAEAHIGRICEQLSRFALVNIQCEVGLYGYTVEQCKRRLFNLCSHSSNLLYTLHSYSIRGDDFEEAHRFIFNSLLERPSVRPWKILVHLPRDRQILIDRFNVPAKNIIIYPVLSLSAPERESFISSSDPLEWKKRHGLGPDDIVIGRIGYFSENKDFITGLKALSILPENYKMAFVGGQHFQTIKEMQIHPSIAEVVDYIDSCDASMMQSFGLGPTSNLLLRNKTFFLGNRGPKSIYEAICNVDIVLVNYLETRQSGSLVASLCLELGKPALMSYNNTFIEYEKLFPDCFEFFNMGNHYEIAYKIKNFEPAKTLNIGKHMANYTIEKLSDIYLGLAHSFNNSTSSVELSLPLNDSSSSMLHRLFSLFSPN